ncbi:MAG: 4-hydroxy-tetrahydrodipicolinate synthase [Bacillota bacterium]|nr:4-hydroxy-tetrahydrodipicolinate synthase [Bacillota bacterium]
MDFGRVIAAMVTPFTEDYAVDYDAAQQLAAYLLDQGVDGLVLCGSTGENPTLTKEEKLKLFAAVKQVTKGRALLIAGTSGYNTMTSVELSQKAESLGADALLAVTPYYNKPPQEGLYQHFKAIAEAVRIPVILYNVPSRTGVNLQPQTVERLAQLDNIAGLKEAACCMEQMIEIRLRTPADFLIYSGDDATTLPMLAMGACGVISVSAHLIAQPLQEMIAAFERGDNDKALELHNRYYPLNSKLFIRSNPIPLKYCLNKLGLPAGPCRLPLIAADAEAARELDALLVEYGLL